MNKVNPKGGAIALGHPLGCTGARQIATGVAELHRTGKKVLCTSMCVGSGMGKASQFHCHDKLLTYSRYGIDNHSRVINIQEHHPQIGMVFTSNRAWHQSVVCQ